MWQTYVLLSLKDRRTYIGSTNSLIRRLYEHNTGRVKSTTNRRPLKLIYKELCKNEIEARRLEKYYKSGAGRRKLKLFLEKI